MIRQIDRKGVSPVIGVILMVAITIILAGVVVLWVVSIANDNADDENDNFYIFNVELNASNDTVSISIISGDILNTSKATIRVDDQTTVPPVTILNAGGTVFLDAPFDLEAGVDYNVKIVVYNRVRFDKDIIAAP